MAAAQALEKEAAHSLSIDDRCDHASLLLQVAVVICSVAILVKWKPIFVAGALCGGAGIIVSIRAFLT